MKRPDTRPMRKTRSQDMNGAGPNQPGDGGFGGLTTQLAKKETSLTPSGSDIKIETARHSKIRTSFTGK